MKHCIIYISCIWSTFVVVTDGMVSSRSITRRDLMRSVLLGPAILTTQASYAASDPKEVVEYKSEADKYSITIPSSWNVITKPGKGADPKRTLFSAIDLQTGSVVTVARERPCDMQRYVNEPKQCDLVIPALGLLSDETLKKDLSKLVIRYDERDNKVLDGTTEIASYSRVGRVIELTGKTIIPIGGTYRDGMGLDQPNTLTRLVQASTVLQDDNGLVTVWISAPEDEWQKPVSGIRLRRVCQSVRFTL